jgi:hypothetical protein
MGENFDQLRKTLEAGAPKDFVWASERYPDEDHGSTVLRAHYAGLKTVFAGWQVPRDPKTGILGGGLAGIEQHYKELSSRFGYPIPVPEITLNNLGYQLLGSNKKDEAITVFKRNVELYPQSANVYDSLGEGLEAAEKFDTAAQSFQKAIDLASKTSDENLPQFQQHLERVAREAKAAPDNATKK